MASAPGGFAALQPQSSEAARPQNTPFSVAQQAVDALGHGYDVNSDLWLRHCQHTERLIESNPGPTQDLLLPGNILIPKVSASIKCDKGDRTRFTSDVLTFNEVLHTYPLQFINNWLHLRAMKHLLTHFSN